MPRLETGRVKKRRAVREYTCAFQRATELDNSQTEALVARILYNLRRIVALNENEARLNSGDVTEQGGQVGQLDTGVDNHQSGDTNGQDEEATTHQASQPQDSEGCRALKAVGDATQPAGGDGRQRVRENL